MASRVFNIPASAPFLHTLVRALYDGTLIAGFPASGDPLELARATIYLPTRRACRLAREIFLDATGGRAAILPRLVPIGDIDEDEIVFAQAATGALAEPALGLRPALSGFERRLVLANIVSGWTNSPATKSAHGAPLVANTPASALALADDLARLMDDMITRGVSFDAFDTLVKDRRDDLEPYWQRSLTLLQVVRAEWPRVLGIYGAMEAAARRDRLIDAEAERLRASGAPVIAAGSTGSMPATAKLIATIAHLEHGAVVLPGLDTTLDESAWRLLAGDAVRDLHDGGLPFFGHPQFALHGLLTRIGIARSNVTELAPPGAREIFVSEALRPAATTEHWPQFRRDAAFVAQSAEALDNLAMIEAAGAEDEAMAIAVALREAAEQPDKTAALITPDRALARRVIAALERWSVPVDDSGGDALADAPAGVFARLAAEAALNGLEPVTLLALLKHPLLRLGAAEGAHHFAVSALERAVLRGARPKPKAEGLGHALATFRAGRKDLHPRDPRKRISEAALDEAEALVARLAAALAPLEQLGGAQVSLAALAEAHRATVAALGDDGSGANAAFGATDGAQLAAAFDELAGATAAQSLGVAARDYAELFEAAIANRTVRLREQPGVRIRILGPLEARLQTADRVVLGGLNEGVWPPETRSDPWLSRPMRFALGLDLPERRVGLAAHDFVQALGAREVILSRAAKLAGAPTVPARFVQRLAALAGGLWKEPQQRGRRYLDLARTLDAPSGPPKPAPRPAPNPPLELRPRKLSVTSIEDWLRDPYTIYARYVLDLQPFDAVDTPPGAADRGSVIHEAIGTFTERFADALPADPQAALLALGERSFAPLSDYPEARAFWWPRFLRIARWFAAWERGRRPELARLYGEINGEIEIPLGGKTFILTARADRIEQRTDGSYVIVDYKTGAPPSDPQVRSGLAPQLTLEAAILRGGGFATHGIPAGSVATVTYVRLKGGEPAGEPHDVNFKGDTPDSAGDYARERLTKIAERFLVDGEPYRSLVHPMWKTHYGDYDHLARVKEWAASGGESEYEGPPA